MGAWGGKLYDCDTANDLRDAFKTWVRLPYDGGELVDFAKKQYAEFDDPESEDHTIVWLVLADLFHKYGVGHAETFKTATHLIDSGADDRMMRALEMEEADLKRRAVELDALKTKWATPNPKPVNRRLLKKPEPHNVESGQIWIYPTEDGNPPNTFFSQADIDKEFKPDGWNAFAVGQVAHHLGYFSNAYVMRLHIDSRKKPDLDTCRRAPISGVRYFMMDKADPLAHVVAWRSISKSALKKMGAELVGQVDLSWDKIRAHLNATGPEHQEPGTGHISGILSVYQRMLGSKDYMDYAAPLDVGLPDLVAEPGK